VSSPGEPAGRHLSSFHLEAVRVGAASAEERSWIASHCAACARCAALAEALDGYRREFAAAPPPLRALGAHVPERSVRRRWSWRLWAVGALAPLAVTGVLLLAGRSTRAPVDDSEVLAKGSPTLGIVARRGERIFPVPPESRVRPGDQIRFVLKRMSYPYGLIASVDGAGRANIYVPYEGQESVRVTPADEVQLEGSIVLDDRLGPERFFALYSRKPLRADAVRQALQAIGDRGQAAIRKSSELSVAADAQSSVLLEKVAAE
jgi:hypothetical protein